MKLISKILMLAFIASAAISCSKDDNGSDSSTPKEVKISYSYSNTADFFELMNVHVEYLDSKGTLIKESIDENWKYEATVPYSSAPAEYKATVSYSAAYSGLENTKDEYVFQSSFVAHVYKVMPNGKTKNVGYTTLAEMAPKKWNADNINSFLDLHKTELKLPFYATLNEEEAE